MGLIAGALLAAGAVIALLLHEPAPPGAPVATTTTATATATATATGAPGATTPHVELTPPSAERLTREPVGPLKTLRGVVRDAATDAPIPRARVAARDPRSGGAVLGGETDAEGRFSLEAPARDLEVMAVAEGWLLPEPTLAPAATRDEGVVVRLDAGVPVRGRVTLAPGERGPLPNKVEVNLVGPSPRFVGAFEPVFVDADGRFEVPGAPPGPGQALVASARGWARARADLPPIAGPVDGVVLELRRDSSVTGTVLLPDGQPAAGATVEARWSGGSRVAVADRAGAFSVEAPPAELSTVVIATAPGYAAARAPAVAPKAGVTLRLGETCPVETTPFLDAQGQPLRGALSCEPIQEDDPHAAEPVDDPREAPFDESGRPLLDALPPGRWSIHMLEKASENEMRAWVLEVEVAPGPPLKLAFDARGVKGTIEGRVLGAPADDDLVQVELRPAAAPSEGFGFLAAVRADSRGGFAVQDVPPGKYGVFASWEGGEARAEVEVREGATAWVEVGP
jgi:hypothetical protein